MKPRPADWFFGVVIALFTLMCALFYSQRFVAYFGPGRMLEFGFYAGAIVAVVTVLWRWLRPLELRGPVLTLILVGIVMHFLGGLMDVQGVRLYDRWYLFGVRYDKYVHLVNAFAVGLLLQNLIEVEGLSLGRWRGPLVWLAVLGLGVLVEIAEYVVTCQVPDHGVGTYDNNMLDLVANCVGGLGLLAAWQWAWVRRLATPRALGAVAIGQPVPEETPPAR